MVVMGMPCGGGGVPARQVAVGMQCWGTGQCGDEEQKRVCEWVRIFSGGGAWVGAGACGCTASVDVTGGSSSTPYIDRQWCDSAHWLAGLPAGL